MISLKSAQRRIVLIEYCYKTKIGLRMATRGLGIALVIIGALLFIGAAVAYSYQQPQSMTILGYTYQLPATEPYRDNTFPLIIGGVALFVVGFGLMLYQPQQQNPSPIPNQYSQQQPTQRIIYCYNCGAQNPFGITYCSRCGKRLNPTTEPTPTMKLS